MPVLTSATLRRRSPEASPSRSQEQTPWVNLPSVAVIGRERTRSGGQAEPSFSSSAGQRVRSARPVGADDVEPHGAPAGERADGVRRALAVRPERPMTRPRHLVPGHQHVALVALREPTLDGQLWTHMRRRRRGRWPGRRPGGARSWWSLGSDPGDWLPAATSSSGPGRVGVVHDWGRRRELTGADGAGCLGVGEPDSESGHLTWFARGVKWVDSPSRLAAVVFRKALGQSIAATSVCRKSLPLNNNGSASCWAKA